MTPRLYRSSLGRCFWLLALLLGMLALAGCQSWNLRGDGFPDKGAFTSGLEKLRPAGDGQFFGMSTKAQEIERSLGQ